MFLTHNVLVNQNYKKNATHRCVQCGQNGLNGLNAQLVVEEEGVKEVENARHQLFGMDDTFAKERVIMRKKHVMKR